MASLDHNDEPEEAYQYDLIDWTTICQHCLRPISATRPPVYNEVNCGCSELGTHAAGITPAAQPGAQMLESATTVYQQPTYTYQSSTPRYVSSYNQTPKPPGDGIVDETSNNFQNLNIIYGNGHLEDDTEITQDQPYTTHSYSWPLHAWLKENESSYILSSTPRSSAHGHKSSSTKAKKGSKRGNSSPHSSGSGMDLDLTGWGPDPFTETGAWVSERYQEVNEHQLP